MPSFSKLNLVIISIFTPLIGLILLTRNINAEPANHVVISEIQVGETGHAENEFVELYNPTNLDVNLNEWRLRVGSGSNLVDSMSGTIKSHGHFLVANPFYTTIPVSPDMVYTATSSAITANSFITLQSKSGSIFSNEDLVGMGTSTTFEGTAVPAPAASKSIERTPLGEDTNNNLNDFILKDIPNPQNSSFIEPSPTASPTVSPTLAPTPIPTESPSPTPTATPSPSASPTLEPTPTSTAVPTETPSPTPEPTTEPTVTPTETPSPTPSETPTITPTESPTPSPTIEPTATPTEIATSTPTSSPTVSPTFSPTPAPSNAPPGWFKSPVFTCQNTHIPNFVYALLKFLMPWKFNCN